jgi:hypothetical protein
MLRRRWKLLSIILIVALLVGGGIFGWQQGKRIELPLMVRDLTIASIAEKRAGDKIPYEADYALSQYVDVYGIITNSIWLTEQMRIIVPFFGYEGINEYPNYPDVIHFTPLVGDVGAQRSFHTLGLAQTGLNEGDLGVVHINERFILEDYRLDERQMLSTLVHELLHFQKGHFLGGAPDYLPSQEFEANTQSATLEVLAAMCNYKNDVACEAFWDDIYSYARGSFRMRLRRWGLEQWYYPIADLLWWDDVDRRSADKSLRYWMNDEDRKDFLYSIIYSYQQRPWEYVVLPGVLGTPLDTGLEGKCEIRGDSIACKSILMPFDDAEDLLGGFIMWLIRSLS